MAATDTNDKMTPTDNTSGNNTTSRNNDYTEQRNDNSNPQQGTGSTPRTSMPPHGNNSAMHPIDPVAPHHPSSFIPYSRPTLKIPPTRKDERKLFVGGLPANVTSEEFRTFFEQFGPVIDSIVMVDRVTMRSRGFGFVTFEDPETSRRLRRMGNDCSDNCSPEETPKSGRLTMMGKTIEVKMAEPKESSRRSPSNRDDRNGNHHHHHHHHHHLDGNMYQQPVAYPMVPAPVPPPVDLTGGAAPPPDPYSYLHYQQATYYPPSPGLVVGGGYHPSMYYPPMEQQPIAAAADGSAAAGSVVVPPVMGAVAAAPAPVSPLQQPVPAPYIMDGSTTATATTGTTATTAAAPTYVVPPTVTAPHFFPYGVPGMQQAASLAFTMPQQQQQPALYDDTNTTGAAPTGTAVAEVESAANVTSSSEDDGTTEQQ